MKVFVTGGSGFIGKALIKYLIGTHGDTVVALCRSPAADAAVMEAAEQGAQARGSRASDYCSVVRGDLDSVEIMTTAMTNCGVVYHVAAFVKIAGSWDDFYNGNVKGTANALKAAKAARCPTFLQVSSFTVLIKENEAEMADTTEDTPKKVPGWAPYAKSKAMAEDLVVEAGDESLRSVAVRPGVVWGPGDTSVIPILRDSIGAGTFRWTKPNTTETLVTFIDNLSYGLRLAAIKGKNRQIYHVHDAESPINIRLFFTKYVAAALPGLDIPTSELSGTVLWTLATVLENIPFVNHYAMRYISRQMLVCMARSIISRSNKAQTELGYHPPVSFHEGLARTAEWTNQLLHPATS